MHFVRAGVVCLCLLASSARAQGTARGLAPDAQLTGGIGAALNGKLDNLFLGRLRLGVLYAFDPFWVGAGAIAEVGALPGLSLGGELEVNQFQGWFGNVGLAYAEHQRITGHLTFGYMVFGVEWQHDFTRSKPNDALLASVRLPLGFWWFTSRSEKKSAAPPPSAATPAKVGPRTRPPAASAAQAPARSPAQPDLDAAVIAQTRGDHAAVAAALRRAYAAEPDPSLWLRIADADQAQGKQALALEDLQRFLASAPAGTARTQAEARVQELDAHVARLRLTLAAAGGGESVEVDGVAQPAALVGYDVVIDPGTHQLRILRGSEVLLERTFEAQPGELVRLDLQLPAAAAPAR